MTSFDVVWLAFRLLVTGWAFWLGCSAMDDAISERMHRGLGVGLSAIAFTVFAFCVVMLVREGI